MIRSFFLSVVAFVALLGFSGAASATSMHPSTVTDPQAYIDLGAQFDATGFLRLQDGSGNNAGFGSFTLINEHWGITAAHNFFDNLSITGNMSASSIAGFGTNALDLNAPMFDVDAVFIHPDFTDIGVSSDIALIRFDSPINSVTPAELFNGELQAGDIVTGVGYGTPGDSSGNFLPVDGFKRGASNEITSIGEPGFGISTDYALTQFLPPNFSGANPLGGTATPGDSGGGLYFGDQIAGVLNFNIGGFDYGSNTGSILLSSQMEFINTTIANNPPVDVPEPSSLALLGMGSLAMLRRKRRAA